MIYSLSERPSGDATVRFLRRQLRWRLILIALIGAYCLAIYIHQPSLFPMPHQLVAQTAQAWLEKDNYLFVPKELLQNYYSQCQSDLRLDMADPTSEALLKSRYCFFPVELPLNAIRTLAPWLLGGLIGAMAARLFSLFYAESRFFRWTIYPVFLGLYLVPFLVFVPIFSTVMVELGVRPWVPRAIAAFVPSFLYILVRLAPAMTAQNSMADVCHALGASKQQLSNSLYWPAGRLTFYESLATAALLSFFSVLFSEIVVWQTGGLGGLIMAGFQMIFFSQDYQVIEADNLAGYASVIWTSFGVILFVAALLQNTIPILCYRRLRDYQRQELTDDL